MKTIAKIICGTVVLSLVYGVAAAQVTVSEQGGAVTLQSVGSTNQAASAPSAQQDPAQTARVPVQANYEKVDRARIEKRIRDRAARTQKRKLEAERDAAQRAAKAPQ